MTIALITDQHLDSRKGSQIFWEYFMKFYDNIFFPNLEKYKIKTIIDLGDTFDNRKSIDFYNLNRIKRYYYDTLKSMNITIHMIVGNHTSYYKNTNKINTPELLLDCYDNILTYSEIQDIVIEDTKITLIPWINSENHDHVMKHISNTDAKIAMGHLEINGFIAHPGHIFEGGINSDMFSQYEKVFSGHFHHKSQQGNIFYLGNPYEIYWNDYNEQRGFHLFDLSTQRIKFFQNPYKIFKKIFYDDTHTNYLHLNIEEYKDTYIKIIVECKKDFYNFDKFLERLYDIGVHEIKIVEDNNFNYEIDNIEDNAEIVDTLTILSNYIEDMNTHCNKSDLKDIIKSVYVEAYEI